MFKCLKCGTEKRIPHSCKSRFCPSCGKKSTEQWIQTKFNSLPDTKWQHITFTMPKLLWNFFWLNRHLMNIVPKIAADIIKELARYKGYLPGIFLAIHTFGRTLQRNFHIHLSTTTGGISLTKDEWKDGYFHHYPIKKRWRIKVINFFRKEYREGRLKLPFRLRKIKTYDQFNSWLQQFFNYDWIVDVREPEDQMKKNVEYLGRYIKRPPIGETRIKAYDGTYVTYLFLDHYDQQTKLMTLPVLDFIKRVIWHIPDKHFRVIRYYGFLATRVVGKKLPLVYKLLEQTKNRKKVKVTYQEMMIKTFGLDPLLCPACGAPMFLDSIEDPCPIADLIDKHKDIALGYHPG